MRNTMFLACAAWALSASVSAQSPHAVGRRDVSWRNTSGYGTPDLDACVCYPAQTSGVGTPLVSRTGGWPVIVFLHGYGQLGSDYTALGDAWASAGFIVVQLDTAQWNYLTLWDDGVALFGALGAANVEPHGPLRGAFDMQRVGIAGHSAGGGTLGLVLAMNPGYRCGLALAPVTPGAFAAGMIHVPFGIVVGTGDAITSPGVHSEPYYNDVASQQGFKFLYTMDLTCNHLNVAGLGIAPTSTVFARVADVGRGFFRRFLLDDVNSAERCVGPTALDEPHLASVQQQIVQPQVWASQPLRIGRRTRLSLAAEEGFGGIIAAAATGQPMPTNVGTLLLDPASAFTWQVADLPRGRRIDVQLDVPNAPTLIGSTFALQAIGPTPNDPLQLGAAVAFVIGQ